MVVVCDVVYINQKPANNFCFEMRNVSLQQSTSSSAQTTDLMSRMYMYSSQRTTHEVVPPVRHFRWTGYNCTASHDWYARQFAIRDPGVRTPMGLAVGKTLRSALIVKHLHRAALKLQASIKPDESARGKKLAPISSIEDIETSPCPCDPRRAVVFCYFAR